MNKKGAEKIISVYWFVILILVAGGIYGMVYMFYEHPFDVRELEANILINNLADCISEKGIINDFVFNESDLIDNNFKENFLDICKINFNVEDFSNWNKEEQFYVKINFFKVDNLNEPFSTISDGNSKWLSSCDINKDDEFNILSKCNMKRFYSVTKDNKQVLIEILSVVRKTEKNVKQ